jgi:hypothetical protein
MLSARIDSPSFGLCAPCPTFCSHDLLHLANGLEIVGTNRALYISVEKWLMSKRSLKVEGATDCHRNWLMLKYVFVYCDRDSLYCLKPV